MVGQQHVGLKDALSIEKLNLRKKAKGQTNLSYLVYKKAQGYYFLIDFYGLILNKEKE